MSDPDSNTPGSNDPLDIDAGLDSDDALDLAITARLATVYTGCVGVVESYDPETQSVTVAPVVRGRFDQGDTFKFPPIPEVPVIWPTAGGYTIIMPLKAGDFVWLAFADRSLDDWEDSKGDTDVTPSSTRRHHISDAVAIPGARPFLAARRAHIPEADRGKLLITRDYYGDEANETDARKSIKIGDAGIEIGTEEVAGSQNGRAELVSILSDLILALNTVTPISDPVTGVTNPALTIILNDLKARIDKFLVS